MSTCSSCGERERLEMSRSCLDCIQCQIIEYPPVLRIVCNCDLFASIEKTDVIQELVFVSVLAETCPSYQKWPCLTVYYVRKFVNKSMENRDE